MAICKGPYLCGVEFRSRSTFDLGAEVYLSTFVYGVIVGDSWSFMPVSIHFRPWSRRASLVINEHHRPASLISDPMSCLISDPVSCRRLVGLPDIRVCYNFEEELRGFLPYLRILMTVGQMNRPPSL